MNSDSSNFPSGTLSINIEGDDYQVRVIRPSNSASLHELQMSLKRNREMLKESFDAMKEASLDDLLKRKKKSKVDYLSPTQNALVARANIDLLIPLINVKGGVAAYQNKKEALPLEKHISKLRKKAAEVANEKDAKDSALGFVMILLVVAIVGLLLFLFL